MIKIKLNLSIFILTVVIFFSGANPVSADVVTRSVTTGAGTQGWQTNEDTLTTCDGSTSSTFLNNPGDYFTVDNTSLPSFDNVTSVDYCARGQGSLTAGFYIVSGMGTFTSQSGSESCFNVAKANLPDLSDNHSIWNVTPIYAFFGGAADTNSSTDCLYVKINTICTGQSCLTPTITPTITPTPTPTVRKINICHYQAGSNEWNSIQISTSAWPAHQTHGDFLYTGGEWCRD